MVTHLFDCLFPPERITRPKKKRMNFNKQEKVPFNNSSFDVCRMCQHKYFSFDDYERYCTKKIQLSDKELKRQEREDKK